MRDQCPAKTDAVGDVREIPGRGKNPAARDVRRESGLDLATRR